MHFSFWNKAAANEYRHELVKHSFSRFLTFPVRRCVEIRRLRVEDALPGPGAAVVEAAVDAVAVGHVQVVAGQADVDLEEIRCCPLYTYSMFHN